MRERNTQIRDAGGMPPLAAAQADYQYDDINSGASATLLERA